MSQINNQLNGNIVQQPFNGASPIAQSGVMPSMNGQIGQNQMGQNMYSHLMNPQQTLSPSMVQPMPQPMVQPQMVTSSYPPAQNNSTYIPIQQPQSPASSSGVNIVIYNPSVNPAASAVANSNNAYNCAPVSYPPNYYMQQPQQPAADSVAKAYLANSPIKEETKTEENKQRTEKKDIVQLTDEYIKTLENYLNNPNVKIREMGVKELMERFKEHKSRYNDVALTNLLNKALQDGSKNVRFVAMTILDAGYAQGDNLTFNLLQQMQSSKDVYGEDAMYASEILLKTAGNKVTVDVPVENDKDKKEKGK